VGRLSSKNGMDRKGYRPVGKCTSGQKYQWANVPVGKCQWGNVEWANVSGQMSQTR